MWDLPGPGLEPMSPALAGGFLTIAPPGKPQNSLYILNNNLLSDVSFANIFSQFVAHHLIRLTVSFTEQRGFWFFFLDFDILISFEYKSLFIS